MQLNEGTVDFNDRIVTITRIKYNSNVYTWREWNKSYGMGDKGWGDSPHVASHNYFCVRGTSYLIKELSITCS
jgi:squalene cyclase